MEKEYHIYLDIYVCVCACLFFIKKKELKMLLKEIQIVNAWKKSIIYILTCVCVCVLVLFL